MTDSRGKWSDRLRAIYTHRLFPWIVMAVVVAAYGAAFPWLYQRMGHTARIFALIQVCLGAWFWGIRGGVLVVLLDVLLNLSLIRIFSGKLVVYPLGMVTGLFLAVLIGRLATVTRQLRAQLAGRRQVEEELRRGRDQLEQVVENRTALLRETNEELRRTISEQRRTEEALRASEDRYRELFGSISDLVYTHDLAGKFLSINPSLFQSLGYRVEEVVGRPIPDFMLPEWRQAFYDEYLGEIRREGQAKGVLQFLSKTGAPHYIEYRNSLVHSEGEETYVSGIGRDVTERILAERELRELEEQLLQSQKMEAIGNLAGGVAHDFNNFLQAVSGYIELLRTSPGPIDPDHPYLAEIETVVASAAGLLGQLLTFSRRERLPRQPLDLNQEVRQTVGMLQRTIPRMIEIQTDLADDLRPVNANQTNIEQVIINLVTNAKDAMPQGGRLTITTRNVTLDQRSARFQVGVEPGEYLRLTVADTGQGMDPETLKHIFEPFFTTKGPGQGTGLGLSTVYGIIKRHGGYVTCDSRPDRGTTFHLYLPALEEMELKTETRQAETLTGGQETILVVDDEPAILDIARGILERHGYTVLAARSGEEALEIYRDRAADIGAVVLDLNMPGMGGPACLDQLRRLNSGARVIVASGYAPDQQQGISDRADGLLTKPYPLNDLVKKVREVLDA